jgi:hypothetical protein
VIFDDEDAAGASTVEPPAAPEGIVASIFMIAGLVCCLAAVVGIFVASGTLVAVLLIGGVGALAVGYQLSDFRRGPGRLLMAGGLVAVTAGAEAAVFVPARLAAALVIAAGLGVLLAAGGIARHRGRLAGTALALIVAVAVPLGGLALISAWVHATGGYVRHYGAPTTVTLPATCTYLSGLNRWRAPTGAVVCEGATWREGSLTVTGTLHGAPTELATVDFNRGFGLNTHVDSATAYAYGDEAFTEGAARAAVGPVSALGLLSPWLALALPVALVAWLVGRRLRGDEPGQTAD